MYIDGKSRPTYVPPEMWSGLIDHWKDPKVIEKFEASKKPRMSEPDGPGTGIRKQRGGSLSIEERAMRKAAERGVSVMDCVYEAFRDTPIFKDGSYTSKMAADIDARVREIAATRGDKANLSQILINDVLGGKLDKKKRLFGTGNLAESLVPERTTGLNARTSAGLDPSVRAEIREELREEL
ncbi:hypothetical protein SASPL_112393 [Salvia splendens]|uniref:Transposase n=1 Tax=Salvia splendens TaxID=180675 RepID=A0A8X9A618_SALSN|nr:hypothetical protein SASPL_112393 [Salvia splendens]